MTELEKYELIKYKWEFLRRNKKYLKEYENYKKAISKFDIDKILACTGQPVTIPPALLSTLKRYNMRMKEKFGVSTGIDPLHEIPKWEDIINADKKSETKIKKLPEKVIRIFSRYTSYFLSMGISPVTYACGKTMVPLEVSHLLVAKKFKKSSEGYLKIGINLDAPSKRILGPIKELISFLKKHNVKQKADRFRPE